MTDRSLQEVAGVLQSLAQDTMPMDPATKVKQRQELLTRAMSMSKTPSSLPVRSRTPWFAWLGGIGAVAVAAALVLVFAMRSPGTDPFSGNATPGSLSRLVIPEAHAGDAFTLFAEKTDAAGADVTSAFVVKTKVAVEPKALQQSLRIVPAVETTVEKVADDTFKIQPKNPLKPGMVYRLAVATEFKKDDGSLQTRDFSWALQTKNDLRILSSIPGDHASRVPVNTGVEFTFTYPDLEDLKPFFAIQPKVSGRFETHGRSVAFVPDKPFATGTVYTVTIKKGVHVKGSSLALVQDATIQFETDSGIPDYGPKAPLRFPLNAQMEVAPGQDIYFQTYAYDDRLASSTIDVTLYSLSVPDTRTLLVERAKVPDWAVAEQRRYDVFRRLAKNQFESLSLKPQQQGYGPYFIQIPKIDRPGLFAVKTQPKGGDEEWGVLQVTNHATYFLADRKTLQLWTVNASTNRVSSNLPIAAGSIAAKTDAQGIARLQVSDLSSTSTSAPQGDQPFFLLEIGDQSDMFFEIMSKFTFQPAWNYGNNASAAANAWNYLFIDRPIYHPADELKVYGFVQDRDSHQGAGDLAVRLQRSTLWYDFFGNEKVYQEKTVKTDGAGHFSADLSWSDLAPGYYAVTLMRNGSVIASRSFEVRDFVKPAFFITVTPNADRVFAGEPVTGKVSVRFYDGTPLVNGTFSLTAGRSAYQQDEYAPITLRTDTNGEATFSLPTKVGTCPADDLKAHCNSVSYVSITVRSTQGEEAEIVGDANAQIYESSLLIDGTPKTTSTTAILDLATLHADLSKDDARGTAWANRSLKGQIVEHSWRKIEDGTYYDFFEKKVYPRYRYVQVDTVLSPFALTTDVNGKARYTFTMEKEKWYAVSVTGADDQGRVYRYVQTFGIGWYDYGYRDIYPTAPSDEDGMPYPHIKFTPDKQGYVENETVQAHYMDGNQPLNISQTPGVLYVVASRGIKQTNVSADGAYSFRFDRDLIPFATVHAITFRKGQFEEATESVNIDRSTRTIDIEARPEQAQYAPGATVKVHIVAKQHDTGGRVSNAEIVLAAVDKSLEGVAYFPEEDPVGALFGYVPDGIVVDFGSHQLRPPFEGGGAEKGGAGDDASRNSPRRVFKDTAAFVTARTDANGEADLTFKAPDNLTSWRTQIVAVSDSVYAGAERIDIPVTKSVFVDVVAPRHLLSADKPMLKLRAYGVGLTAGAPVTFTVDIPSLGVNKQTVQGQAYQPVYIAIDKLVPGHHVATIQVTTSRGSDALERSIDIVDTAFFHDEQRVVEATPGATLGDLGQPEAYVTILNKGQGELLPQVRRLSDMDWSGRVDAKVAARLMQQLLKNVYQDSGAVVSEDSLQPYLDAQGGIKLLPYGSPDPELTEQIATTAPELFDQSAMQTYLYALAGSDNRETQIAALSGLAALHEPTLLALQKQAALSDLSWREQLMIARGLFAAGDQGGAQAMLRQLLKRARVRDDIESIIVSDKPAEVYEATADTAALAASLADPSATKLAAYVRRSWSDEAFPLLAKARYLKTVVPTLPGGDMTVSWTTDGKTEQTVSLKTTPIERKLFTREEAKNLRVTKVTGPIVFSYNVRTPGRPASVPEVSVNRSYQALRPINALEEGDTVGVTLDVAWQPTAQNGCYVLDDHLPGGLEPVVNTSNIDAPTNPNRYPLGTKAGEVSFTVCKWNKGLSGPVTYLARIVSRGTYTAEAPLIQNMEHPSIAAVGKDQVFTVK